MKQLLAALMGALLMSQAAQAQQATDPFLWLEDIEAPRAMAWIETQNAKSAKRMEADPRYQPFLAQARAIFTAKDRIPWPEFRAGGVDNLWQDETHTHGVWRHSSLATYRGAMPAWQALLDLDDLSKTEGRNPFARCQSDCLHETLPMPVRAQYNTSSRRQGNGLEIPALNEAAAVPGAATTAAMRLKV